MDIKVKAQRTPNPFAYKYLVNMPVKTEGKATFNLAGECEHVPLAKNLLSLDNITQIHFFDNAITVTQNGISEWAVLHAAVEEVIHQNMAIHDPQFQSSEELRRQSLSPELQIIEKILDDTIRPSLQMDGGDVEVLKLEENELTIRYEGACGSCPSSAGGTLDAIESVLRSEYSETIVVLIDESVPW